MFIRLSVEIEVDFYRLPDGIAVHVLVNDNLLNKAVQRHSVQLLNVRIILDDLQPAGVVTNGFPAGSNPQATLSTRLRRNIFCLPAAAS